MKRSIHKWFVGEAQRAFAAGSSAAVAHLGLATLLVSAMLPAAFAQYTPDPGCTAQEAWPVQANPSTDPIGKNNINFPLDVGTYWAMELAGSPGSSVTIKGQFPAARYMALQVYDSNQNVLADLRDDAIDPDPGQNNPYRGSSSTAQGTYTVQLVMGPEPAEPPPNTLYTGSATAVILIYRVYYPNDYLSNPDDVTGGTVSPVLPTLISGGVTLPTCPPRPVITPQAATVWGTLSGNNFVGVAPPVAMPAFNPPRWLLTGTNSRTADYPNQDNNYMTAILSREYLTAPYNYDLAVIQMQAPTFTDTQAGVPPYAGADVRFWGMCTDELLSTGVVRCIPDDQAPNVNGMVTFVISDPSKQPPASVLSQWGASWLAWGALQPSQYVYNAKADILTNADGVYYYNLVMYRQTLANPAFTSSIANVSQLPLVLQQAAMGGYWPKIGYCKLQDFQTFGPACIGPSR